MRSLRLGRSRSLGLGAAAAAIVLTCSQILGCTGLQRLHFGLAPLFLGHLRPPPSFRSVDLYLSDIVLTRHNVIYVTDRPSAESFDQFLCGHVLKKLLKFL